MAKKGNRFFSFLPYALWIKTPLKFDQMPSIKYILMFPTRLQNALFAFFSKAVSFSNLFSSFTFYSLSRLFLTRSPFRSLFSAQHVEPPPSTSAKWNQFSVNYFYSFPLWTAFFDFFFCFRVCIVKPWLSSFVYTTFFPYFFLPIYSFLTFQIQEKIIKKTVTNKCSENENKQPSFFL